MTTQSHYASVQTQRGYCLFIFHVKVMDGLCKEEQKERQMVKESSLCLICIRNRMDRGSKSPPLPNKWYHPHGCFKVPMQRNHWISLAISYEQPAEVVVR